MSEKGKTCTRKGQINGLSQETYCEQCVHSKPYLEDHHCGQGVASATEAEPVYQWRRKRLGDPWHDASHNEAYSREDDDYEARTLYILSEQPTTHAAPCARCDGLAEEAAESRAIRDKMADKIAALEAELQRIHDVANCGTVDNWITLSDEKKREWFAMTLHTDSEKAKIIKEQENTIAQQADRIDILSAERDMAIARYERVIKILNGIHALLYPPTIVVDGKSYAFHSPMLHEQMQQLSDRIRAIPDEIAREGLEFASFADGPSTYMIQIDAATTEEALAKAKQVGGNLCLAREVGK